MSDISLSPKNLSGETVSITVDTISSSQTANTAYMPGCVGLRNLGNTCFMNSGLQCLFSNSIIAKYFIEDFKIDDSNRDTLAGYFAGLVRRCWAGKYRVLIPEKFKNLCLRGFRDYQQQDCQEFLMVCLDRLNEILKVTDSNLNMAVANLNIADADLNVASNNSKFSEDQSNEAVSIERTNEEVSIERMNGEVSMERMNEEVLIERMREEVLIEGTNEEVSIERTNKEVSIERMNGEVSIERTNGEVSIRRMNEEVSIERMNEEAPAIEGTNEKVPAIEGSSENMKCMSEKDVCKDPEEIANSLRDQLNETNVPSSTTHGASVHANLSKAYSLLLENFISLSVPSDKQMPCLKDFEAWSCKVIMEKVETTRTGETTEMGDTMETEAIPDTPEVTAYEKAPSFEDICMKEAKTSNTNVQLVDFEANVSTDSNKFHKPSNAGVYNFDEVLEKSDDCLHDYDPFDFDAPPFVLTELERSIMYGEFYKTKEVAGKNVQQSLKVKDTNLHADVCCSEKHPQGKKLFMDLDLDRSDINNVKKIRQDEDGRLARVVYLQNLSREPDHEDRSLSPPPGEQEGDRTLSQSIFEDEHRGHGDHLAKQAQDAWVKNHKSIIDDTFTGLFMNTLECPECNHKSVSFDPFVFLTLPIPWVSQLQLSVTLLRRTDPQAVRYVVSVDRNWNVAQLKEAVKTLAESQKVLIAEVQSHYIVKMLDDQMPIRSINVNHKLYAFEAASHYEPEAASHCNTEVTSLCEPEVTSQCDPDVTSQCDPDLSNEPDRARRSSNCSSLEPPKDDESSLPSSIQCGQGADDEPQFVVAEDSSDLDANRRDNDCDVTLNNSNLNYVVSNEVKLELSPDVNWQHNQLDDTVEPLTEQDVTSTWSSKKCINKNWRRQTAEWIENTEFKEEDVFGERRQQEDDASSSAQDKTLPASFVASATAPVRSESQDNPGAWRTCAICLEEMADCSLKVHPPCRGTLCLECLEMSFRVANFGLRCPVCRANVNPATDFVLLDGLKDDKCQARNILLRVMFRVQWGKMCTDLFGHPNVIGLPNPISGESLYRAVMDLMGHDAFKGKDFKILITDLRGLKCSRCTSSDYCFGCELKRDDPSLFFQPGDHLVVNFLESVLTKREIAEVDEVFGNQTESTTTSPINLLECIETFMKSDTTTWECPTCKESRSARKRMTVWKYPNTLIVHLMRFSFRKSPDTNLSTLSNKIDSEIDFPVKDLDLSQLGSNRDDVPLLYDLQSYVCHYGDLNNGHYTALAKHPVSGEWFKFNDDSYKREDPSEVDFSAVYLLFYQRKDTSVTFELPKDAIAVDSERPVGPIVSPACLRRGRTSSDGDLRKLLRPNFLDDDA